MLAKEDDISPVLAKIQEERNIDFSLYRDSTLRRRLSRRLAARQCADITSYLSILESDPHEYDLLLRDLTIKYTEFFRDTHVYDLIQSKVIPDILAAKRSCDCLNIWSAACATGEEAYSLAIMVKQIASEQHCSEARILGTDIDPSAITTARAGRYVKDLMPKPLDCAYTDCFDDDGKRITVLPELKQLVEFRLHDLTAPSAAIELNNIWSEKIDLIMCRNILMYLRRSTQTNVLELCYDFLKPGGFLVIGTGETVPKSMEKRLIPIKQKAKIYRKECQGI